MPMIVCIDTNYFVQTTHMLRKGGGAALIHALSESGGRIFIPEILIREYRERAVIEVNEECLKTGASFSWFRTMLGRSIKHDLPDNNEVLATVSDVLLELKPITIDLPLTDTILLAAARRTMNKQPPTSKTDHGYKDCVIWESVLCLGAGTELYFITKDKSGFPREGAVFEKLSAEAKMRGIQLVVDQSFENVLKQLQVANPAFNHTEAFTELNRELHALHSKLFEQWGLQSLARTKAEYKAFDNGDKDSIYVTFLLQYDTGSAVVGKQEYTGPHTVEIIGSFTWHSKTKKLSALQVTEERLLGRDGQILVGNITMHTTPGIFKVN